MIRLEEVLEGANTIAIAGHIHPDGDAVGSALGLSNYIWDNYPCKKVSVFLADIPEVFCFLNGVDKICNPLSYNGEHFDVFFSLDSSDTQRLGEAYPIFKSSKRKICIDHHESNSGFADENYIIPNASSTSEMVCSLLDKDKISKNTAECLYMGIVHDTGVFQYSSTSSATMRLAGILMEKGIDYPRIIEYTFYEKTFAQNKLLGRALLNARLFDDNRIIASVISKDDFSECNATRKDTEGIVNQLRITKDCDVAILLYENPDRTHKASLRASGDINVAQIALEFGGGGHAKAAGCTVGINPWEEIEKIIAKVVAKR